MSFVNIYYYTDVATPFTQEINLICVKDRDITLTHEEVLVCIECKDGYVLLVRDEGRFGTSPCYEIVEND